LDAPDHLLPTGHVVETRSSEMTFIGSLSRSLWFVELYSFGSYFSYCN
jgi:hypothetical protein